MIFRIKKKPVFTGIVEIVYGRFCDEMRNKNRIVP